MKLVGLVASHPVGDDVQFVDYVCTAPTHRRRGVARYLFTSLGSSKIHLITQAFSPQYEAYTRMGFVVTTNAPYETAGASEVAMYADDFARDPSCAAHYSKKLDDEWMLSTNRFEDLPWAEVERLLRSCGLRRRGIARFLRPGDADVTYRLVHMET